MAIDENGVHSANRLNVGDETRIAKHLFPDDVEIGNYYTSPVDSDHWILIPNDGLKNKPCVVRVEDIQGDTCICVVTELHREES